MNIYSRMQYKRLSSVHIENGLTDNAPQFERRHTIEIEASVLSGFDNCLMGLHGFLDGFAARVAAIMQASSRQGVVELFDHLGLVLADVNPDRRFLFDHVADSNLQEQGDTDEC